MAPINLLQSVLIADNMTQAINFRIYESLTVKSIVLSAIQNLIMILKEWAIAIADWFSNSDFMQFITHLIATTKEWWTDFLQWFMRPEVQVFITVWWVAFIISCMVIYIGMMFLGFGPLGVVAGSLAAWVQSTVYGAFTPAGGIFAILTSMAMSGSFIPVTMPIAMIVATVAAMIWGHL